MACMMAELEVLSKSQRVIEGIRVVQSWWLVVKQVSMKQ